MEAGQAPSWEQTVRKGGGEDGGQDNSRLGAASRLGVGTSAGRRAGFYTSTSRLALVALLGAGASLLPVPAWAANFNVGSASQLEDAINRAANGDTITFTSNITLGSNLPALTKNVTIQGNGKTLSGGNLYRGFIVGNPLNPSIKPTVAINNLAIVNGAAIGGFGGPAYLSGGGAGGGWRRSRGGLLVLAGANVTVTNVSFQNGTARGGGGGQVYPEPVFFAVAAGGGGGGYLTNGKRRHKGSGWSSVYRIGRGTGKSRNGCQPREWGRPGRHRNLCDFAANLAYRLWAFHHCRRYEEFDFERYREWRQSQQGRWGTLMLNGANTYLKTFIQAGQVAGNSTSIRGDIAFQAGASIPSVKFDQGETGTFGGNVTGAGALLKTGAGQLTLTGNNSYSGGTFIFLGTLQGTSNSLQGNIVNDSRVVFNQDFDGTFGGNLSQEDGIGTLIKAGAGNLAMTGTNFTTVTNVIGGTLTVNGSLGSPVAAVNDSGTLVVNGEMTSEAVSVNSGGSLAVNGNLTSPLVTISPGGELQGHGNITGDVDDKGGEIAPGNSIGTLHIFGPLEMEPHSEYQVQINGASSDEIEVSQTAKIESSTFEIERYNTASSPVVPGKTYTILTTGGGLAVEEPTLAIADFPFINFTLSEDGFNGYLTTSRSAERFAELASTPNEAAVANALDSATSSLAWQQVVGASTADAQAAFSSLSNASIHASAAGVLSEQSHFLRDAVLDRPRQDFPVGPAADPESVLTYGAAPGALPTKKAPAAMVPMVRSTPSGLRGSAGGARSRATPMSREPMTRSAA